MTRWVQYKNDPQGQKWEVLDMKDVPQLQWYHGKSEYEWYVRAQTSNPNGRAFHVLPKSEYRECAAPEVWKDVTAECHIDLDRIIRHGQACLRTTGYRARKVAVPNHGSGMSYYLIIEQQVQP